MNKNNKNFSNKFFSKLLVYKTQLYGLGSNKKSILFVVNA